jgi:prepilin-type N-terminal cleavage/methylation domain-containing protein/prepilin-type processing-associated H-X9-DG protein
VAVADPARKCRQPHRDRALRRFLLGGSASLVPGGAMGREEFTMLRERRAFTLIELLVVIAIIAILAAILFPVFARARENARKATCGSNQKQVANAVLMYVQDYDETMPPFFYTAGQGSAFWTALGYPGDCYECPLVPCYPYVKNMKVTACPSASETGRLGHGSIAFNCQLQKVALATLAKPAEAPMVFDANCHWVHPAAGVPGSFNTCNGGRIALDRHSDGMNIAFADGHVKWLPKGKLGTPGQPDLPPFWDPAYWNQ